MLSTANAQAVGWEQHFNCCRRTNRKTIYQGIFGSLLKYPFNKLMMQALVWSSLHSRTRDSLLQTIIIKLPPSSVLLLPRSEKWKRLKPWFYLSLRRPWKQLKPFNSNNKTLKLKVQNLRQGKHSFWRLEATRWLRLTLQFLKKVLSVNRQKKAWKMGDKTAKITSYLFVKTAV